MPKKLEQQERRERIRVTLRLQYVINQHSAKRLLAGDRAWTASRLAEAIDEPSSVLSRLINGKTKRIDLDMMSRLCTVLECMPCDLFSVTSE